MHTANNRILFAAIYDGAALKLFTSTYHTHGGNITRNERHKWTHHICQVYSTRWPRKEALFCLFTSLKRQKTWFLLA